MVCKSCRLHNCKIRNEPLCARHVGGVEKPAHCILTKPAKEFTGKFCIDDTLLVENGVTDFDKYRVDPSVDLMADFFVPEDSVPPVSLKAVS